MRPVVAPILALFFALIIVLAAPETSLGEAYQWKDADGNTYYGSKPPAGARRVERVAGKNFSRYSSSKLLSGYSSTSRSNSKARARLGDSPAPMPVIEKTPIEEENLIPESVRLEESKLSVNHDDQGRVINCKVTVRNTSNLIAKNVLVSFEFEDGSIIPARGPESIAALGDALYFIEPSQLPIVINRNEEPQLKSSLQERKQTFQPKPHVVIQSSP